MIGSSRLALARPVRKPPNSCLSTLTAPRIRRSISLRSKLAMSPFPACPPPALALSGTGAKLRSAPPNRLSVSSSPSAVYRGRGALSLQDRSQAALALDGKHNYRNPIVPGKGDCGPVHDAQILLKDVVISEPVVTAGVWRLFRIGAIDAVDLGRLEQGVAAHLCGPQRRRRVGGGVRGGGAAGEDHHPALVEMVERLVADIGLANGGHGDC